MNHESIHSEDHLRQPGRLITLNTLYNITGQAVPLLVGLITIPIIVHALGTERFGVLTLAWLIFGYFTLFDMGIGRATTKFVSECIALGRFEDLPRLVLTSLFMLFVLGCAGGLLIAAITPWLIHSSLSLPSYLIEETNKTFYLLAVTIPFVIVTSGARGVLEAQHRFAAVNAIKIPAGILNFIVPVFVLQFSTSLNHIVAFLVISRIITFSLFLYVCFKISPGLTILRLPDIDTIRTLLKFGGWMTVSNLIDSVMTYGDRFLVGILLNISAVAYYSTPYDIVTKIWIISSSILGALFPVISSYAVTDRVKLTYASELTSKYILIVLVPIVMFLVIMAGPFLDAWLGREFFLNSAFVMQLLAIGTLLAALAHIPFVSIQALGRPDITAKIHIIEMPVYLLLAWFCISKWGIIGGAGAWLLRNAVHASILNYYLYALSPNKQSRTLLLSLSFVGSILLLFITAYLSRLAPTLIAKSLLYLTGVVLFFVYSYIVLLNPEERNIKQLFKKTRTSESSFKVDSTINGDAAEAINTYQHLK